MILTFPDPLLAQAVGSSSLLSQTWPVAFGEVMILLHILRLAAPSLVSALATGLVSVIVPRTAEVSSRIMLAHRTVTIDAVAKGEGDVEVLHPHLVPAAVPKLDVADLVVAGRSVLQGAAG
ncbi:hypothetical protein BZB76_0056 [Actinomadura pelletieri DSM 43383]|uniref:Uncharacterized protein n=1 Tax=Actinomadura pelletieri DSM 43383 TaxID=1120940 RepID=A0A495QWT6_9ACTN|nr:hypothetical protein [Actinomadura pelletieri]RKS78639.1 hypothetical protein BZB76_0056 [Actinomadura pelletieri DSM 43383]